MSVLTDNNIGNPVLALFIANYSNLKSLSAILVCP